MAVKNGISGFRALIVALAASAVLMAASAPASAGFFDRLFGGITRAIQPDRPPSNVPFQDPLSNLANHLNAPPPQEELRGEMRGPAKAFCVRTCDGRFFPVQSNGGVSAAESCHSFCPSAETRLYSGASIDSAVGADGRRYADLPNAFVYRKQMVSGCSCNGRNAFGITRLDSANDPTLRPGDIVATGDGMMAFTGGRDNGFTPVGNYSQLPKTTRDKLAETKISQQQPAPAGDITASVPISARQARAEAR